MKREILTLLSIFIVVAVIGFSPTIPAVVPTTSEVTETLDITLNDEIPDDIGPAFEKLLADEDPNYSADFDIGKVLADRDNLYSNVYEPWKSKAAIHSISYDEDTGFLALGGGYLYDNEVHIYRLNIETGYFDKVWDSGDTIIQSDVLSLDIGDTDVNSLTEIVAGSSDGHVYVFEQRHIYDPYTKTENMFDHVWTSPNMFRVFEVRVFDADRDFRPDIVVGAWDGLFLFEYDLHSGYPFDEEHWITYRQTFSSGDLNGERIYSMETGDTNENGLPEIIVGTREGTIYVFENDGLSVIVNGQPFPLLNDDDYYLNWTSVNYTWTPIRSMAVGELDGTPGDELAIIAQGQGVFTLDWNPDKKTYDYDKVVKDYEPWETFGFWGLDYFVDRVTYANNVTYHDPDNGSIVVPEPIQYVWGGSYFIPDASVYPYNTGMAGTPDGNYSTFDASNPSVHNATAIVDYGLDEEGTGSASAEVDIQIRFQNFLTDDIYSQFNFSISRNGEDFEQVANESMTIDGATLLVDVDDALQRRRWDYFRYAKLSVYNGGYYEINSVGLQQVYNLLTDALSVTIGPLRVDSEAYLNNEAELDKVMVGTVTGKFIGIGYDDFQDDYDIIYDSGAEDFYAYGSGIWDLTSVQTVTDVPVWRYLAPPDPTFIAPYLHPPSDVEYNSWSYGKLDPTGFADASANYFLGTDNSEIIAYDMYGNQDPVINSYFNPINSYLSTLNMPYTSVEVANMYSSQFNQFPVVAVASFNPLNEISGNPVKDPSADITFFYRGTVDGEADFTEHISIFNYTVDIYGEIGPLVALSKTTPKMDFIDYDGDVDQDMVFSNGKLYLAKNHIVENGGYYENNEFTLVRGYFDEVNDAMKSGGWGQPELFDLDGDGDHDLIISYATLQGATAFINEGTNTDPVWVEDERIFVNHIPDTNMRFLNLTDLRVIPNDDGNTLDLFADFYDFEVDWDFNLVSMHLDSNATIWAEPVYGAVDSYIVATYPKVVRMEFAKLYSGDNDFRNFGFNVRESWSNEEDLEDWTMAISSGDIDGDGNGEIAVGDYDNNAYVFEHLVNNTYKRMYRSFDFNHTVETDQSPYLYDELEGITGVFNRRIWDHAENLLVDVDLDQDGLKEMIVTANLQVYIFEDKGLTGGDQLQLVYSFDIRDSPFNGEDGWDKIETITAIASGDDLDYDGRNELILGAGPFLFVFNVPVNDFEGTEENDYFITDPILDGRYYLVGNPLAEERFEYAHISTIVTGDTDEDNYREIILGGTLDTRYIKDDGFVHIYESQGGTFYKAWEAPDALTRYNPVSSIVIDDQDYDSSQEIIIGHTKGFDMWEWMPGTDSMYQKVEHVTSSPNYPIIDVKQLQPVSGLTFFDITDNGLSSMANGRGGYSNYIMKVYTNSSDLYSMTYDKSTGIWSDPVLMFPADYGDKGENSNEMMPSVAAMPNGDFYVVWRMKDVFGDYSLWIAEFDYTIESWGTPVLLSSTTLGTLKQYPSVFEWNSTHVGALYTYDLTPFGAQRIVVYGVTDKSLPGTYDSGTLAFKGYENFNIQSADAVTLSDDSFAVAMSALNYETQKPDYDIWVIKMNESFNYFDATPHQATSSYEDEINPEIDYLRSPDESLIVIYENIHDPFEERVGMVGGTNDGRLWGRPDYLNTLPPTVVREEDIENNQVYYTDGENTIAHPLAISPSVVAMDNAGFMYTFIYAYPTIIDVGDFEFWIGLPQYGINQQSDWVLNHHWNVEDIDVGDTDRDGRREVILGFEDRVAVYELKSSNNGTDWMAYEEVWLSDRYENDFTDLTVYDSSGNGFEEIAVATERGDVYFLEYLDPSEGATELSYPDQLWNRTSVDGAVTFSVIAEDIDNDTYDEVVVSSSLNNTIEVLDHDLTVLWADSIGAGTYWLNLHDLDLDGQLEVISGNVDGSLYVLDSTTGTEIWSYSLTSDLFYDVDVADLDNDGIPELVAGSNNGSLWVFRDTGDLIIQTPQTLDSIYTIKLGRFTESNTTLAAFGDSDEVLRVVFPLNGTVVYESPPNIVDITPSDILAYDFDNDGVEEVVFVNEQLHILDARTGEIFYNSSFYGNTWHDIHIHDFDGDNEIEVLSHLNDGSLALEDINGGATQWRYTPDIASSWDIDVGNLGGTGELDIAMVSDDGVVIAIDGKSGVPMYFKPDGIPSRAVAVVDFDGDGMDTIITLGYTAGTMTAFEALPPVEPTEPEPMWTVHSEYLSFETNSSAVKSLYGEDITGDGYDEIVTADNSFELKLWNATTGQLIWNNSMGSAVRDVQFGEFNGEGYVDLAVRLDDNRIVLLKGETGAQLAIIPKVEGFATSDFAVGFWLLPEVDDEVMVMFEKDDGTETFLVWYGADGTELYRSNFNLTDTGNTMDIGHIDNSPEPDVIVGGNNMIVQVYRGSDGQALWNFPIGNTIVDLKAAYFSPDDYEDFVVRDILGNVYVIWSFEGWIQYSKSSSDGIVRTMTTADINGDNVEELVLDIWNDGVVVYDQIGVELWKYDAPLVSDQIYASMSFADWDGDSKADLLYKNYDYLQVIDGDTGGLSWHYHATESRIRNEIIGHFSTETGPLDVAYIVNGTVVIVSGSEVPLVPPSSPSVFAGSIWTSAAITTMAISFPLILLAIIPLIVRKRREEELVQ